MAQQSADVRLRTMEGGASLDEDEEKFALIARQWYRECRNERNGFGSFHAEMTENGSVIQIDEGFKMRVKLKCGKPSVA